MVSMRPVKTVNKGPLGAHPIAHIAVRSKAVCQWHQVSGRSLLHDESATHSRAREKWNKLSGAALNAAPGTGYGLATVVRRSQGLPTFVGVGPGSDLSLTSFAFTSATCAAIGGSASLINSTYFV